MSINMRVYRRDVSRHNVRDRNNHNGEVVMRTRLVADPSGCGDGVPCPKIWQSEDGRYWLQGARPPAKLLADRPLPADEFLVELDPSLIGWTPPEE
jgi:hypothetical protein